MLNTTGEILSLSWENSSTTVGHFHVSSIKYIIGIVYNFIIL